MAGRAPAALPSALEGVNGALLLPKTHGSVEMRRRRAPVKCKFCPFETTRTSSLRSHAASQHRGTYEAIQRWLRESTDEKLAVAEALAAEGMKGLRAT